MDSLKSVFDVCRRKPSFGALTAIVARSMGQNLYSATKAQQYIYEDITGNLLKRSVVTSS